MIRFAWPFGKRRNVECGRGGSPRWWASYAFLTTSIRCDSCPATSDCTSAPVRTRNSPSGMASLHGLLPQMGHLTEMLLDPLVRIDGVQISLATIRQNDHTDGALGHGPPQAVDRHDDRARRSAGKNRFAPGQ